jgi:hypothetical protein
MWFLYSLCKILKKKKLKGTRAVRDGIQSNCPSYLAKSASWWQKNFIFIFWDMRSGFV